jgi:hypothetical protein
MKYFAWLYEAGIVNTVTWSPVKKKKMCWHWTQDYKWVNCHALTLQLLIILMEDWHQGELLSIEY